MMIEILSKLKFNFIFLKIENEANKLTEENLNYYYL